MLPAGVCSAAFSLRLFPCPCYNGRGATAGMGQLQHRACIQAVIQWGVLEAFSISASNEAAEAAAPIY